MEQTREEGSAAPNVFAVDLRRASQLAHIPYEELISGIHSRDAIPMQGIYLNDMNENKSQENQEQPKEDMKTSQGMATKRRSLVLAMAPNLEELQQRRRSSGQSSSASSNDSFEGFVVNVKEKTQDEAQPLLAINMHDCTIQSNVKVVSAQEDEYTLALPADSPPSDQTAFLIQQPRKSLVLAVPEQSNDGTKRVSLVRRLSGLPSNIKEVAVEAAVVDDHIDMQICVQKSVPPIAYAILCVALISVSSQGAAMQALEGVPPILKMAWRFFGASCLFSGLAFAAYRDGGLPTITKTTMWQMAVCVVSYTALVATFIWALDHTSVSHAYIFNNAHSLLFVVGKCALGQQVALLEAVGAILGVLGGVITSADGQSGEAGGLNTPSVEGDIVALLGAVGGVFYLTYAKELRGEIGVWNFCFVLFTGTWFSLLLLLCLLQVPFDMSTNSVNGFFGWIHHLGIEFVLVGIVTTLGSMGFVSSMKYFSPLVVSVTMLLEPVVATAICIALGMAPIPGWLTFVGGLAVTVGTLLVISNSSESFETTNVTEAVVHTQQNEKTQGFQSFAPASHGNLQD